MKKIFTILAVALTTSNILAQIGSFTDTRDGKIYKTIKIGTQIWMAENLAYKTSNTLDKQGNSLAWCTGYPNNINDATKYGYLYSFEAAKIACPTGWHLPTDAEWDILIKFLGGASVAGGKMKEAGTSHWQKPNVGATNSSGFNALPGGYHNDGAGHYENILELGIWWSSTPNNMGSAWIRSLSSSNVKVGSRDEDMDATTWNSYSVRCIKDDNTLNDISPANKNGGNFLGIWGYKENTYKDESLNHYFLKITKAKNGRFNLLKGHKDKKKINWGNIDGSMGTGVNLQLLNGKLVGTYRLWEGSAPDAFSDITVSVELNSNNILLFKMGDELIEATKINK